jgi:DNA topoisomerase IB
MRLNKLHLLIEDEIEYVEPTGYFTFAGIEYPYWGSPNGRSRTINYDNGKFNRYAKLGEISNDLVNSLESIVKSNTRSVDGRCAYASLIMMIYGIRIGNEGSAEGYISGLERNKGEFVRTFGTTTLLNEHISFSDSKMHLAFLGKEQVSHSIEISEPFFVKFGQIYHRSDAPQEKWLGIDYGTLFNFVKDNAGMAFVPKDLRTFCANTYCWKAILQKLNEEQVTTKSDANAEISDLVERVASRLGNTPNVCKNSYLDRRSLDWFKAQRLVEED